MAPQAPSGGSLTAAGVTLFAVPREKAGRARLTVGGAAAADGVQGPNPSETRPRALTLLYLTYVGVAAGQFAATKIGRSRGGLEANPVLAYSDDPVAQLSVALGVGALTFWLVERQWKRGHRIGAIITMAIVDGINAAILIHDVRWLAGHPAVSP